MLDRARTQRSCQLLLVDILVCDPFSFGAASSSAFEALRGHRPDGGDKWRWSIDRRSNWSRIVPLKTSIVGHNKYSGLHNWSKTGLRISEIIYAVQLTHIYNSSRLGVSASVVAVDVDVAVVGLVDDDVVVALFFFGLSFGLVESRRTFLCKRIPF